MGAAAVLALGASLVLGAPAAFADDWHGFGLSPARSRVSAERSGAAFGAAGRWSHRLPAVQDSVYRAFIASPAIADGFVIAGGSDRQIRALRERDGALAWTFSLGDVAHASPAVQDGLVFAASVDRQLYALRLDTGAVVWNRDLGGMAYASPVAADGSVFVAAGNPSPRVIRLNAASGDIDWIAGADLLQQAVHASVAIAGGHVLVGEMDGRVHAFAAATGAHQWTYRAGGTFNLSSPLVAGDRAYFLPATTDSAQRLFAVDLATGAGVPGWPIDIVVPDDPLAGRRISRTRVLSSPAGAADGTGIVFDVRIDELVDTNSDNAGDTWLLREITVGVDPVAARVAWMQPNGRRVTRDANLVPTYGLCPTPAFYAAASGSGGWVATASTLDSRIRVLDLATGVESWSAALSTATRGSPAVANGRLFVATDGGEVHAFLSETNLPPEPPAAGFFPTGGQAVDPLSVRFSWSPALDAEGGALRYQLRFDSDGEVLRSFAGEITTAAGQSAARAAVALAADQTYAYAIRSRDPQGAWSAWSAPQQFRTVAAPPVSIAERTFASLPAAVAAALPGDTIRLGAGTYHLSNTIAVSGGVSLEGAGPHLTVIDARGLAAGISVDGAEVRIRSMTVRHATRGIEVRYARDVELRNVILRDNRDSGLEVGASGSAQLINATLVGNDVGVRAHGAVGVRNTLVTRNRIGMAASDPSFITSRYNDVFANDEADRENVTPGAGDLSEPVRFLGQQPPPEAPVDALDLRLQAAQASTDRGDPADGFEREPPPNGGRVNIGAFGDTPFAESSAAPAEVDGGATVAPDGGAPVPTPRPTPTPTPGSARDAGLTSPPPSPSARGASGGWGCAMAPFTSNGQTGGDALPFIFGAAVTVSVLRRRRGRRAG